MKIWKVTVSTVLLLLTIQLTLEGFFREKRQLPNINHSQDGFRTNQKVILMLVDALREDFVAFDSDAALHKKIPNDHPDTFRGR